jgi:peptidoglycan/LPS O-acetylase OafA/YrhL
MAKGIFHPGLEGLRGIALLAVFLFHADPDWLPGGFLSVSTFFTLSGFLITGVLIREWEAKRSIRLSVFWARRVRRLLPASLLGLLGIALLGRLIADDTQMARLSGDGLAALFYFSNWWLIITGAAYDDLMGSPSLIQHFWTLSIEEQYYFLFPLFMLGFLRLTGGSGKVLAAFLVAVTALSWSWLFWLALTDAPTARLYYGTDTRAGELLAGGALALWLRTIPPPGRKRSILIGIGLLGLAITLTGWLVARVEANALYQGGFAIYTLGSLAVIASAVQSGGPVRALLSWSLIRWVGRISYGAYIYHWPIFLWVEDNFVRLGLTLLLAHLSYQYIEEPIRFGRRILGWHRYVAAPAAIAAIALAFYMNSLDVAAPKLPAPTTLAASGDPLGRPLRIGVVGDSLAVEIGAGLQMWAEGRDLVEVKIEATRGCGLARGAWLGRKRDERKSAVCEGWPGRVKKAFEEFRPNMVVVVTTGWDMIPRGHPEWTSILKIGHPTYNYWLLAEYDSAFGLFRKLGAHVAWLTTPCMSSPNGLNFGAYNPKNRAEMNRNILPKLAARHADQLTLVDLEAAICPDGKYAKSLFGIEDFRRDDGIHLSQPAQHWVGTWLGERLLEQASQREAADSAPAD